MFVALNIFPKTCIYLGTWVFQYTDIGTNLAQNKYDVIWFISI